MTKPLDGLGTVYYPPRIEEVEAVFGWTLDRYHEAIKAGILTPNDKVELLFGQLIPKMSVGESHPDNLTQLVEYFFEKFGLKYKMRQQNPVTLPNHSEPEPDLVVVARKDYGPKNGHPQPEDICLLVEISQSTLRYDRGSKARAYALAGVKEYWIVNLENDQLEMHLQPDVSVGVYKTVGIFSREESFDSPFCGPVRVNDLLPSVEEE